MMPPFAISLRNGLFTTVNFDRLAHKGMSTSGVDRAKTVRARR